MLSPRWIKIWRDLNLNRVRTVLVVLSIAAGVFVVGVIGISQLVLTDQLDEAYIAINPTSALMITLTPFQSDVVDAVRNMAEVEAADARASIYSRLKKDEDEWLLLQINAIDDFENIEVDKIRPDQGQWPPKEREILLERSAMRLLDAQIGDTLIIKDLKGREREVKLVGTAQDMYALMYTFQNVAYAYVNFDTMEWLGQPRSFNDLRFKVADDITDVDQIKVIAKKVQDKMERGGANVLMSAVPTPGKSPLNLVIQPILLLLGAFGLLALLLSAFLVINMIAALIAQQRQQIGIMKAVGAKPTQIVSLYFTYVLVLGFLSLVIALPLGVIGARAFSYGTASTLNIDLARFYVPPVILVAQVVVSLIVPVLAATFPILKGTQVTAQEAISGQGMGKGIFGQSLFDRALIRIQVGFLKRPIIISLRNTFRRKARLILTLITLTLGGAIFVAVFSIQASLQSTLDKWLAYYNYDVAVLFQRPYRIESLEQIMGQVPGVEAVEGWAFYNVRRVRDDNSESDGIIMYAPPADTTLVKPTLLEGRWLTPEDENAVVINTLLLNNESDLAVGDEITLKAQGRESSWTIVGIALGGGVTPAMFSNYEYFSDYLRQYHQAEYTFLKTTEHTPEFRREVLKDVETHLENLGLRINAGITVDEDIAGIQALFAILVAMMLVMAVLLAVVGGLGLMSTMSINVLERTREMGVMRAIGATNRAVLQIVEAEGILIGILSWFFAIAIAIPISKSLSDIIGEQFLSTKLSYTFSFGGAIIWLVLVIVLSAIASFLPAWNAARITVREALAYE